MLRRVWRRRWRARSCSTPRSFSALIANDACGGFGAGVSGSPPCEAARAGGRSGGAESGAGRGVPQTGGAGRARTPGPRRWARGASGGGRSCSARARRAAGGPLGGRGPGRRRRRRRAAGVRRARAPRAAGALQAGEGGARLASPRRTLPRRRARTGDGGVAGALQFRGEGGGEVDDARVLGGGLPVCVDEEEEEVRAGRGAPGARDAGGLAPGAHAGGGDHPWGGARRRHGLRSPAQARGARLEFLRLRRAWGV